jgi:hypothetical protein
LGFFRATADNTRHGLTIHEIEIVDDLLDETLTHRNACRPLAFPSYPARCYPHGSREPKAQHQGDEAPVVGAPEAGHPHHVCRDHPGSQAVQFANPPPGSQSRIGRDNHPKRKRRDNLAPSPATIRLTSWQPDGPCRASGDSPTQTYPTMAQEAASNMWRPEAMTLARPQMQREVVHDTVLQPHQDEARDSHWYRENDAPLKDEPRAPRHRH